MLELLARAPVTPGGTRSVCSPGPNASNYWEALPPTGVQFASPWSPVVLVLPLAPLTGWLTVADETDVI